MCLGKIQKYFSVDILVKVFFETPSIECFHEVLIREKFSKILIADAERSKKF